MKSWCTTGLVLLVGLGRAASVAHAQSDGYWPTLTPVPPVTQNSSGLVPAGYYDSEPTPARSPAAAPAPNLPPNSTANDQFSSFSTRTRGQEAQAAASTPATKPSERSDYEQAMHETCWDNYDSVNPTCGCGCGWFGAAGGLVLTRNRGETFTTTYQGTTGTQLMTTQDAKAGWTGGGEVTVGYAFGGSSNCGPYGASGMCGKPGVAFTWWGTGEMQGFSRVRDTTGVQATALDASFDLPSVTINGNPFSFYFQGASEQRIYRSDIANSFEANLLAGSILNTGRLEMIGLLGFRYFRFTEDMAFGSASFGNDFNSNGGADSAFVAFRSINNLYGVQLGSIFNFNVSEKWSVYLTPKAGIYGNAMSVRSQIYSGDGVSVVNFTDHKSDFAFLGQIDAGMTYAIRPNLRAYLGYRVVGIANLALGEEQFTPSLGEIKQSGALILHGANMGLAFMF